MNLGFQLGEVVDILHCQGLLRNGRDTSSVKPVIAAGGQLYQHTQHCYVRNKVDTAVEQVMDAQ